MPTTPDGPTPTAQALKTAGRSRRVGADEHTHRADGTLVICATAPIDGAVASSHRPTILVVDGVQWAVRDHRSQSKGHTYTLVPWAPGPFERAGAVLEYDPHRVAHARAEQLSFVVRTLLLFVLFPLGPLVGLLAEQEKTRLRAWGLLPPASQTTSLMFHWLVVLFCAAAELGCIVAERIGLSILLGAVTIVLLVDIAHRIIRLGEGRDAGMLSWPREWIQGMRVGALEQRGEDVDKGASR